MATAAGGSVERNTNTSSSSSSSNSSNSSSSRVLLSPHRSLWRELARESTCISILHEDNVQKNNDMAGDSESENEAGERRKYTETLLLTGYQLYVNIDWLADRSRLVKSFLVHTGYPTHSVKVVAVNFNADAASKTNRYEYIWTIS